MGKTHDTPRQKKPRKPKSQKKPPTPELTPEESARLAAFDAVIKMRDEHWAAMTPEEQAEELAAWKRVRQTINGDRAGYRQVFADE